MPEIISNCPICGSGNLNPFEDLHTGSQKIHYLICKRCGAIFQSPRMDASELEAFYEREYRLLSQQTEDPTKKDLVMQEQRARDSLKMIRDDLSKVSRHLDIGSSSGALLEEIHNEYGSEAIGIEPGEAYRRFSQQRGLQVLASLDSLTDQAKRFDLVSMMHVLEHLRDPVETLSEIRRDHMTLDSHLLVEVPNAFEHEALEVAHLFAFTPANLREIVHQSGFEVIWTKTHGGFRSPILKLYITLLARPSSKPHKIRSSPALPWWIRTRRSFGKLKRTLFTRYLPDWTWQAPRALWDIEDDDLE
ncbi:MAG: class I SAM-dependent methyltransferase [Anaerolineales bacterium]|jgi:2-polyprenyl-3-methyl-5-hydroxy-6-metoxy-1,4-benzoquinol methylase